MMMINLLGHRRPLSVAPAQVMLRREELNPMLLLVGFILTGLVLIAKKITQ